ncbi:MAG: sigma-70 family RNA polymerase sigma factor [Chlorobi bacterium]|nr:MAG: ECF subfamily RNA polymerase sigma-70 factor [Chlorobi bacterium OLB7]MBK8911686.1 sigma-70 family RNA polymerase sigma factor [Chlorobiota bacterium]MBX7216571.1 sigma-70 family RNA polymerase sigma factor [Candidatus Kapabacteria bacterium]
MTQLTDEELIRQTLEGREQSFAELVRRYERRVAVTIKSVVGDIPQDDMGDIAQEIFVLAFRALGSFRGESLFSTWLTRIALRYCYRESKRRKRKGSIFTRFGFGNSDDDREPPEERFAGSSRTDQPIIAQERKTAVMAALKKLPEEFRTVLVLRVVEELSVEEVAEMLGISTGTVKSRLFRAKDKMRELLAGHDVDVPMEMM